WEAEKEHAKGKPLPFQIQVVDPHSAVVRMQVPEETQGKEILIDPDWSVSDYTPRRLLVKFKKEANIGDAVEKVSGTVIGGVSKAGVHFVQLPAGVSERARARTLGQRADVEYAELDRILPPAFIPNDPTYPSQWHHPTIGSPAAWNTTTGS